MKGLPLLGSLRMLSLGFLPDKQRAFGLGSWPSKRQVRRYVTDVQFTRMIFSSATRLGNSTLLMDKVRFAELVSGFASTPKILAVVQSGRLFPTSADVPTADTEGLAAAARVHDGLVLKPRAGGQGRGVLLLVPSGGQLWLDREAVQPATLDECIRRLDSYIVTPRVRQARYAAAFFGKTTNTIRMLTMVDPRNGEAFVAFALQRIGTEASFPVDNTHRGGVYSMIDLGSGRLGAAWTEDDARYEKHPDSGAQIEGVTIPRWIELLDSIRRLAQKLGFIDYIGWDVVVTEDGFSVLEGNPAPSLASCQRHCPLMVDERVRAFYRHHLNFRKGKAPR